MEKSRGLFAFRSFSLPPFSSLSLFAHPVSLFGFQETTWEPRQNLNNCTALLKRFEKELKATLSPY